MSTARPCPARPPLGGVLDDPEPGPCRLSRLVAVLHSREPRDTAASRAEDATIEAHNETARPRDRRRIPPGFAEGSEAWRTAVELRLPLVSTSEQTPTRGAFDLFTTPVTRFEIDYEALFHEGGLPLATDNSERPAGFANAPCGPGDGVAWSADRVAFFCPRGICIMPRAHWEGGWRHCSLC